MVSCNVCILYLLMPKGVQSTININYVKRKLLWAKQNYIFCIIFFSTHFFSWYLGFDDRSILNWKKSTSHESREMDGKNNKIWENDKAKNNIAKRNKEKYRLERDSVVENYTFYCWTYLTLKDENRPFEFGKLQHCKNNKSFKCLLSNSNDPLHDEFGLFWNNKILHLNREWNHEYNS